MAKAKRKLPQGWMSVLERKWLQAQAASLPSNGRAIEVGSWRGRSTIAFARRMRKGSRLYAVDTWAGTPEDPEQHDSLYAGAGDVFAEFKKNLRGYIKIKQVIPYRVDSQKGAVAFVNKFGLRSFDFVFIDADHRYPAVKGDIEAYAPLVKRGGLLAGHDYAPKWPGVRQAVDEAYPTATQGPDTIWSVRL